MAVSVMVGVVPMQEHRVGSIDSVVVLELVEDDAVVALLDEDEVVVILLEDDVIGGLLEYEVADFLLVLSVVGIEVEQVVECLGVG